VTSWTQAALTAPDGLGNIRAAVQSMRAIRGRALQFSRAFEKSLVPMLIIDNERRYLDANAAARLAFRLSLEELLRRRVDDLTPPHMLPTMHQHWNALMRRGVVVGPYEVGFPDGSQLKVIYCALANVLPGRHLIVFAPAEWPEDELATLADEPGPPPPASLSPREREVVTLIAHGADLQAIADELTISVTTVRTHTRNALRKLGARSRAHAITLALQAGLIKLAPRDSGH
jgi:DNA-binding NarL/FixJ family response regulator